MSALSRDHAHTPLAQNLYVGVNNGAACLCFDRRALIGLLCSPVVLLATARSAPLFTQRVGALCSNVSLANTLPPLQRHRRSEPGLRSVRQAASPAGQHRAARLSAVSFRPALHRAGPAQPGERPQDLGARAARAQVPQARNGHGTRAAAGRRC